MIIVRMLSQTDRPSVAVLPIRVCLAELFVSYQIRHCKRRAPTATILQNLLTSGNQMGNLTLSMVIQHMV